MKTKCPECELEFKIENPKVGEVITCPDCALNLQVESISNNNVILVLSETEAEDWGQ